MYRISVTALEKFRRYMNEESSYDTEASVLESLRGGFKGNDKTIFGHGYHHLFEGLYKEVEGGVLTTPPPPKKASHQPDTPVFFRYEQALPAMAYNAAHRMTAREIDVRKIYRSKRGPIEVNGRLDAIEGIFIRDGKVKFRDPGDLYEYRDSCQWKFYCHCMESDVFYYDIFEVSGFKEFDPQPFELTPPNVLQPVFVPAHVEVKAHDPFQCLAYPGMELELVSLLNDFMDWLHFRNYTQYLKHAYPLKLNA